MRIICSNFYPHFKGCDETIKRKASRGSFYMGDAGHKSDDSFTLPKNNTITEKNPEDAKAADIFIARINASAEKDVEAQIALGDIWLKSGNFSGAASQYEITINLLPETDKRIFEIYKKLILSFVNCGHPIKASDNMKKLFKIPLNDADSYNNRGVILAKLGSYNRTLKNADAFKMALTDFQRALKLDCEYATAYFNKAKVYYILGELVKYRDNILKAMELYDKQKNIKNYYQCLEYLKTHSDNKHKTDVNIKIFNV